MLISDEELNVRFATTDVTDKLLIVESVTFVRTSPSCIRFLLNKGTTIGGFNGRFTLSRSRLARWANCRFDNV